jgi:hypothetical protein
MNAWLVLEAHSAGQHFPVGGGNLRYREVQDRAGMIEFRFLGDIEHQAHAAAVEEG